MRQIVFWTVLALWSAGLSTGLAATDYNAGWIESVETAKPVKPAAEKPAAIQPATGSALAASTSLSEFKSVPMSPPVTEPAVREMPASNLREISAAPERPAALRQPQEKLQPATFAGRKFAADERLLPQVVNPIIQVSPLAETTSSSTPSGLTAVAAYGYGTGFFVTPDIIATNWHIVKDRSNLSIIHLGVSTSATLAAKDESNDLALLKINNPTISRKASPLPIIDIRLVNVGEKVYSVGFPDPVRLGFRPKITDGLINSIGGEQDNPTCYQVSTPVQPGNSGSPLLNGRGQVVGIISRKWSGNKYQNVAYAVKSNHLVNLLLTLPEGVIIPEDPVFANPVDGSSIMLLARDAVVTVVQHGMD